MEIDVGAAPAILTLLGKSGAGKSTTANLLLRTTEEVFTESDGTDPCTTTIAKAQAADGLVVYDTPGIGDANFQSHEYFSRVTEHLNTIGGCIAWVHEHGRVDQRVLNHVQALSMALKQACTSATCVLIITKWPFKRRDRRSPEVVAQVMRDYVQDFQRKTGTMFARSYVFSTAIESSTNGFVEAIVRDLHAGNIQRVTPGSVITWAELTDEQAFRSAENQKQQLERAVEDCKARVKQLEAKSLFDIQQAVDKVSSGVNFHPGMAVSAANRAGPLLTCLAVATVAVVGAAVVTVSATISANDLANQREEARKDLERAEHNLEALDITDLVNRRAELMRLLE